MGSKQWDSGRNCLDPRTAKAVQEDKPPSVEWRTAISILVFACVAVVVLFRQTFMTMAEVWVYSRTFAHGSLVLPATLYLIWCYRDRLTLLVPTSSCWGLLLLFIAGVGWLVGHLLNTSLIQQVAVVAMFPGLFLAILGPGVLRVLLFPLGFLVFALPIGTSVEPWLQSFTAAFIVAGLQVVKIPVYWDGTLITIPSGTWEVARDCGGLRYVLPGLALSYLYVAVMYRHWGRRLGFLLLCVALLILANGVRAYGIILVDHLGFAEGADHRVFSYAMYGMTMMLLLWLGLKWREPWDREPLNERVLESGSGSPIRETALTALGGVGLLALAPLSAWLLEGPH